LFWERPSRSLPPLSANRRRIALCRPPCRPWCHPLLSLLVVFFISIRNPFRTRCASFPPLVPIPFFAQASDFRPWPIRVTGYICGVGTTSLFCRGGALARFHHALPPETALYSLGGQRWSAVDPTVALRGPRLALAPAAFPPWFCSSVERGTPCPTFTSLLDGRGGRVTRKGFSQGGVYLCFFFFFFSLILLFFFFFFFLER